MNFEKRKREQMFNTMQIRKNREEHWNNKNEAYKFVKDSQYRAKSQFRSRMTSYKDDLGENYRGRIKSVYETINSTENYCNDLETEESNLLNKLQVT